uniref:Uncharacterized protein n=1 Tax=Melanopsichium pennsylvanicum 4 TaxID=1398559 RepID=A0A077R8I3_9BASI|nr:uncharacterized protein BN887_06326 [Melanopsichium pennsylvanicum 4]
MSYDKHLQLDDDLNRWVCMM